MVKPLVVADGEVVGTWSRPGGRVDVRPFPGSTAPDVDHEAEDVRRFLDAGSGP